MDLSTLKLAEGARKRRKRLGRGTSSGSGKTCGRGHKGAKSRSGYSRKTGFEGGQMPLNRRLPKRGFYHETRFPLFAVNLDVINDAFENGEEVTPAAMLERKIARYATGGVKVLARGEITKQLILKVNAISDSARTKVEAAGGSVEILAIDGAKNAQKA